MSISRTLTVCLFVLLAVNARAEGVPNDCTQLILGIAPTWNSMRGELRLFERSHRGDWVSVAGPFPVLFGKNGLAWGTGLAGQNEPGLRKKERSEEHTSELQSRLHLVCRLLLEKKKIEENTNLTG